MRLDKLLQPCSASAIIAANAMGRMGCHKALREDESKRKLPKIILLNDCRDPIKMSKGAVLWPARTRPPSRENVRARPPRSRRARASPLPL